MRLAFMGTPEFAVPTLDALLEAGHEVVAVYTQPPRPGGRRGKAPTPSPVHKRAEAAGIEVRTPERLRGPEEQAAFVEELPDVFIPIAGGWGRMGMTHVVLANADEDLLRGALQTAWRLRVEANARTKTKRRVSKRTKA